MSSNKSSTEMTTNTRVTLIFLNTKLNVGWISICIIWSKYKHLEHWTTLWITLVLFINPILYPYSSTSWHCHPNLESIVSWVYVWGICLSVWYSNYSSITSQFTTRESQSLVRTIYDTTVEVFLLEITLNRVLWSSQYTAVTNDLPIRPGVRQW